MNGRRGIMKNRGVLWGGKGEKMDDFATIFPHEINKILKCKMGTVEKILDRGMRPSRVFKR